MNENDVDPELDAEFVATRQELTLALEALAEEAHAALDTLYELEVTCEQTARAVSSVVACRNSLEKALSRVEVTVGLPRGVRAR